MRWFRKFSLHLASTVATVRRCATNCTELLTLTCWFLLDSIVMLVFRGVPLQIGQDIAPKGNESHYNIRKNIGIFGELVVSFKVPVGWNIILLIFKEIDCFPLTNLQDWGDHAIDRSLWCLLVLVVVGFWGVVGFGSRWTLWDCCIPNLCTNIVNTEFTVANGQSLPSSLCEDLALCKTWCHPPNFSGTYWTDEFPWLFQFKQAVFTAYKFTKKKNLTSSLRSKIPMLGRWFISLLLQNVLFSVVKDSMLVFSTYTV